MANAIGMVELTSIARGIETSDFMVKAAQVELIRSSTVCPGKYIIIIAGDTGDVKASMAEGIRQGGESVVNTLLLPNAHPQLIPAISMTTQPPAGGAVGVLEFWFQRYDHRHLPDPEQYIYVHLNDHQVLRCKDQHPGEHR